MFNLRNKIRTGLHRLRRGSLLREPAPVNWRAEKKSPQQIVEDVDYAMRIGRGYLNYAAACGGVKGKRILEIGPGVNFGSSLMLKCCGAKTVAVSDRYLAAWQDDYHTRFYTELKKQLRTRQANWDTACLDELIASKSYVPEVIGRLPVPLENMADVKDGCFDIVFSNAVLEHLSDHERAFRELNRVSARGAYGFHQVDFRDHRDFARPLEYLMCSKANFEKLFRGCFGECGNQLRPSEMEQLWQANGFHILDIKPTHYAEDEYLESVIRRLRLKRDSKYFAIDKEKLRVISAHFTVKKGEQA